MSNLLLFLMLFLLVLMVIFTAVLYLKVRRLEEKSIDMTPNDVVAFVDQMRDMLIASEYAAEKIDASLKEREALLEDLNDLIDKKLSRIEMSQVEVQGANPTKTLKIDPALQKKVYTLIMQGFSEKEVAVKLGITPEMVERTLMHPTE